VSALPTHSVLVARRPGESCVCERGTGGTRGYPKWIGERAGSILHAMTTTELAPLELAVALVVSVLGGDCWDGWGRGGGDVGAKPAIVHGDAMAPAPCVSLFLFADEPLEEVVQEQFGKVDWPNATTDNINVNRQSRTKNENRKCTSHVVWHNTGRQHTIWWKSEFIRIQLRIKGVLLFVLL
jgi:hypothetical protein